VTSYNARNIYRVNPDGSETHVGCMFTEEDGQTAVATLNQAQHWYERCQAAEQFLRYIPDDMVEVYRSDVGEAVRGQCQVPPVPASAEELAALKRRADEAGPS
jgi:hypothetical protein